MSAMSAYLFLISVFFLINQKRCFRDVDVAVAVVAMLVVVDMV